MVSSLYLNNQLDYVEIPNSLLNEEKEKKGTQTIPTSYMSTRLNINTTTQKEWEAIASCAMKAQNKYTDSDTKEQVEIVRKWCRKWLKNRDKNRAQAREWNKKHPERHRQLNLQYYYRNRDKVREYQKKYYQEVLKEKRKNGK